MLKQVTPLAIAAVWLGACSPSGPEGDYASNQTQNAAATDFADRMAGTPKPLSPAKPFQLSEKTPTLEFAYAWPAAAAAIPEIDAKLRKDMAMQKADALKMATQDQKSAKESGYPFRAHSLEKTWAVSADTSRFLALKSEVYSYTGGAHGMSSYDVLLWDKPRDRETSVQALMTSPAAFAGAVRERFCAALDQERAKKRGEPVARGDDPFTQCIDLMQEVLLPSSKDGKLIDGITVVIAPYSAGPYAEGSYEISLPVDAAMRKAIKTEYQDAFAPG